LFAWHGERVREARTSDEFDEFDEQRMPSDEEIEGLKAAGLWDPEAEALMGQITSTADQPLDSQAFVDPSSGGNPVQSD
jgi:hypothetical protein